MHGGHRVRRHAHHQGSKRQDSDCQSSRDQGFGQFLGQVVCGASHRDQSWVIDISALHIARFFSIYLQGTPTDYLSQKQLNRILFLKISIVNEMQRNASEVCDTYEQ